MAHFHIKKKKGKTYLYVREIARVDGRPKVISQIYIGSPDRVAQLASGTPTKEEQTLKIKEFGALWVANKMDTGIDLAGLIDEVIPRDKDETGPSVGEYFLYYILNHMIEAHSQNTLADWYTNTAIQQIRPVNIQELTTHRYQEKWNRVEQKDLEHITQKFFHRLKKIEDLPSDSTLFDTPKTYPTPNPTPETNTPTHCHLFARMVVTTYLKRLKLKLNQQGIQRTATAAINDMGHLHAILTYHDGHTTPNYQIETPTKTQAEVLAALGYQIDKKGALQPIST